MASETVNHEVYEAIKAAEPDDDGRVVIDVSDVVDRRDEFHSDALPFAIGYWGRSDYGLVSVDWVGRRLLFLETNYLYDHTDAEFDDE